MGAQEQTQAETLSAEREMIDWIRDRIRHQPACRLPDLEDALIDHFTKKQGFMVRFFRESIHRIAYDLAQRAVARTRGVLLLGDETVSQEEFGKRSRALRSKWETWMEHSGDRHIKVLSMRRGDLAQAIEERRQRGDREYTVMAVLKELYKGLPDDEALVGDVFKPEDIARIEERISVVVNVVRKEEKKSA